MGKSIESELMMDDQASSGGPAVMGERLVARLITDHGQGGIPVGVLAVPETWRFESRVVWDYAQHSNPVALAVSAENPTNAEAFYSYPAAQFFFLRPQSGFYAPGQNVGGIVHLEGMPPEQALLRFIQQARASVANLEISGMKELPGLAAALELPPAENQRGIGVRVTYEQGDTPLEEEFYAVSFAAEVAYDGPQGRTWQINWGLNALHSFRAEAGSLDRRRPVFSAIAKSFRANPDWQQRLAAINSYLAVEFNRQIQAGYDAIAAAGRLSQQISANNDAMLAAIDRQLRSSPRPGSGSGASSSDRFSDYIRGVDTVDDPYYGTSQHSYNEQFHWTDGYGSYRNSNDVSYDPNQTEVGNWQRMQRIR